MVKRAVVWCQDQHLALTNAHVAVSGRLFRPFHVRARSTAKLPVHHIRIVHSIASIFARSILVSSSP